MSEFLIINGYGDHYSSNKILKILSSFCVKNPSLSQILKSLTLLALGSVLIQCPVRLVTKAIEPKKQLYFVQWTQGF